MGVADKFHVAETRLEKAMLSNYVARRICETNTVSCLLGVYLSEAKYIETHRCIGRDRDIILTEILLVGAIQKEVRIGGITRPVSWRIVDAIKADTTIFFLRANYRHRGERAADGVIREALAAVVVHDGPRVRGGPRVV